MVWVRLMMLLTYPALTPRPAQKQRTLGQAAARLVHRDRGHIRAGSHAAEGQPGSKIQVGAVRLVHQGQHMVFVRQLDQAAQVGADAVIGGVIDKDRHRVGVCLDGRADVRAISE